MNSRIEKIVFILTWYVVLVCLRLLLPVPKVDFEIELQYYIASLCVTLLICYAYFEVRNYQIMKTIDRYLNANNFEACAVYIARQITKHKKTQWLQLEEIRLMAMRGSVAEFKAKIISVDLNKKNERTLQLRSLKALYDILNGEVIRTEIQSDGSHLDNIVWILANRKNINTDILIEKALLSFDSQYTLIKAIAAKILSVEYSYREEQFNAELFDNKVKEFTPSDEMYALLGKSIN